MNPTPAPSASAVARVQIVLVEDAPRELLVDKLSECYTNYRTFDYLLQTRSAKFQRRLLRLLYREFTLPSSSNPSGGVWILATDIDNEDICAGLLVSHRSFGDGHTGSPATTFGKAWGDIWQANQTANPSRCKYSWLRTLLFTVLIACVIGPWALRRLLRYNSQGKELNRRCAVGLLGSGAQASQSFTTPRATVWRVDHVFTMPCHRGRGLCRQLFQAAFEGADDAGATLYLSTSATLTNVPIYRRLGFEVVGAVSSDGTYLDAGQAKEMVGAIAKDVVTASKPCIDPAACPQVLFTTGMARAPKRGAMVDSAIPGTADVLQNQSKERGCSAKSLALTVVAVAIAAALRRACASKISLSPGLSLRRS